MCGTVPNLAKQQPITLHIDEQTDLEISFNALGRKIMTTRIHKQFMLALCAAAAVLATGCTSLKTPATADVAVSRAAVDNAAGAGAAELAPAEMTAAREKMARANQALAAKDYKLARDLAGQAQADAKLAQSKANSAKATSAADALNEDIRIMREELDRANATK
jgi:hypothetical protein